MFIIIYVTLQTENAIEVKIQHTKRRFKQLHREINVVFMKMLIMRF